MDEGLPSELRIQSEQSNVILRQYERNAARTERAHVKLKPNKTHQDQILLYPRPDREGDIGLEYCHTNKMVADFMTKPLQGKSSPSSETESWECQIVKISPRGK